MAARMAVKKAGWMAVCLVGLTVGQLAGCWTEAMVETRVGLMAVRMAAQRADSRAVSSADSMVGWMAKCWAET